MRIFDDRAIEQSKLDPLAGLIGELAGRTKSLGNTGDRLGMRLMIRPAPENWGSRWQNMMQARRDGEDRAQRAGGPTEPSGPSFTTMAVMGGLGGLAFLNWTLWQAENYFALAGLDLAVVGALLAGVYFYRKHFGKRKRPYLDEDLVDAKLKSLAFWSEIQLVRIYRNMGDVDQARADLEQVVENLSSFDDPAGNSWHPGKIKEFNGRDVMEGTYKRHPFVGGGRILECLGPKRAQRSALSAREAASLWHLPLGMDEMASMERTASAVLVPYLAELSSGGHDAGPLVGVANGDEIRIPESAIRKHAIILGRSGVGKSTMIKHIISHKLERKARGEDPDAIVVVDPHADLVRDILKLVPEEIADKVRLLDFGRMDRVPGINLVDPSLFRDRDRCVDTIIETVKHLWEHWGGRLEDLLKRSLLMVYEYNSHPQTRPDEMLTMLDILALLDEGVLEGQGPQARTTMSPFQREVLSRVRDPRLKQWFDAYLNWPRDTRAEAVGPVYSRVGAYAADQRASVIMGQRESTITLSSVLEEGLVLLVSTARGTIGAGPAALMGGTMVSLVESALRDQESISFSRRRKCLLVCDEFQTVTGANWEGLLAEIRKYGCSLMLATQSLARLDTPERKLKAGVLGNVGCIIGYQMAAEDAEIISAEMDRERVQERYLVNLHPHHCYVRINSEDKCYPAFSMQTLPPPDVVRGSDKSEVAVINASRAYTVSWEEAKEKMDAEVRERLESGKIGGGSNGLLSSESDGAAAAGAPAGDDPNNMFVAAMGSRSPAHRSAKAAESASPAKSVKSAKSDRSAKSAKSPKSSGVSGAEPAAEPAAESATVRSMRERQNRRVESGELKGVRVNSLEDSAFTSDALKQIVQRINTDSGLREAVDRRVGNHVSRERKKVRETETERIRNEAEREMEERLAGEREKIRAEEAAKARAELAAAAAPAAGRPDPERIRRIERD